MQTWIRAHFVCTQNDPFLQTKCLKIQEELYSGLNAFANKCTIYKTCLAFFRKLQLFDRLAGLK